jgi:hypothetical protein
MYKGTSRATSRVFTKEPEYENEVGRDGNIRALIKSNSESRDAKL